MAALQDIFAFRNISEGIERVKTGIPDVLPAAFSSTKEKVFGNETTFHTSYGERRIVNRAEYGAGSRAQSQKQMGQQPIILAHYPEHILVEQELLLRLRQPNDLLASQKAKEWLETYLRNQKARFTNTRIASTVQMLWKGTLWYDTNGKLLQSSSGAVDTIDMAIPAGNKNQIGGRIDASWATPSTNIFQHIELLKKKQIQDTGRPIKKAFYGINIPQYVYLNTSFKQYFQLNPVYYQAFAQNSGAIPNGFMGIDEWIPMSHPFYEQTDATKTQLWGDDFLALTPEITKDVYTLFEGSMLAPTQIGIGSNTSVETGELVYGMGGYSVFMADPIAVKVVVFDNMLPMWKNPLDLLQCTVAF